MNKQRKVLITITYNEMGIIIDTKAEEVAQSDLQPTCNQLATDCINRSAALDVIRNIRAIAGSYDSEMLLIDKAEAQTELMMLPSAQQEPTYEQVMEYCKKRCMSLVTNEFLAHMYSQCAQPERKGEWILAADGWYCSVCELYPPFDCDPEEKGIPYCPNCGADMR